MRILFVTSDPHRPEGTSGPELGVHALCRGLLQRDVAVAVLAASDPAGAVPGPPDTALGYPMFRSPAPRTAVVETVAAFNPHLAVIDARMPFALAQACLSVATAAVIHLHHIEFQEFQQEPDMAPPLEVKHGLLSFVANSLCTATAFQESYGIAPAVIRPLLPLSPAGDDGASASSRQKVVLFDPVLAGGVDIALGLAALRRDLQFDLVEDGVLDRADMACLLGQRQWLGNVRLVRRPAERREIYRDAGLLLVPPRREIGWCRAVTEAQACGVPALAVRSGGLPEAVGAGGVVVPRNADLLRWRDGLAQALDDPERYRSLSEAARNAVRRPELAPDRVADQWLDVFSRHLARIGYVM